MFLAKYQRQGDSLNFIWKIPERLSSKKKHHEIRSTVFRHYSELALMPQDNIKFGKIMSKMVLLQTTQVHVF